MTDQNQNPLNQESLKALRHFKVKKIDQLIPYSLQLTQWILNNRGKALPYPPSEFRDQLADQADMMSDWSPTEAEELLEDSEGSLAGRKLTPLTLGIRLVENLHDNLQRSLPALRTPETPYQ